MSVYDVLAQAIEERRVVTFTYDGFLRVVEPFLLGTTTAGRSALRAYQTAGGSRSGTVPGWHLFSLGKIVGLATCQKRFSGVRDGLIKVCKPSALIFSLSAAVARPRRKRGVVVDCTIAVVLNHGVLHSDSSLLPKKP